MGKCILNESLWCETHQMFHVGRNYELSQDETELGEKYRAYWTRKRALATGRPLAEAERQPVVKKKLQLQG